MNELIINKDDLVHNINIIKNYEKKENYTIFAVVKGNAYGLGVNEFTKVLIDNGINNFAVASSTEAINLRKNIKEKILLLTPYINEEILSNLIKNDITLTIDSSMGAGLVNEISKKLNKKVYAHIKIDTGFNRLGFKIDESLPSTINYIYNLANINVEGIFSHLALKDEKSDYDQFNKFINLLDKVKRINIPIKHICDSIGMVAYKDFHMDMVRVGASLYGYNSRKSEMDLKPAMTFKSKFAQIKTIKKGEGISYDYSYIADKDMKVGTVLCGYSDGIPRILSNKGYVYVNGKKANILGKICMDQCIVDLTDIKDVSMDSEVIFYGNGGPNLLDVANLADTNRNELLSIVSRRVARVYIKDKKIYKILDYLS